MIICLMWPRGRDEHQSTPRHGVAERRCPRCGVCNVGFLPFLHFTFLLFFILDASRSRHRHVSPRATFGRGAVGTPRAAAGHATGPRTSPRASRRSTRAPSRSRGRSTGGRSPPAARRASPRAATRTSGDHAASVARCRSSASLQVMRDAANKTHTVKTEIGVRIACFALAK